MTGRPGFRGMKATGNQNVHVNNGCLASGGIRIELLPLTFWQITCQNTLLCPESLNEVDFKTKD